MKKSLRLAAVLALFCAFGFTKSYAQLTFVDIIGPNTVCSADCADYTLDPDTGIVVQATWVVTGPNGFNQIFSEPEITVCFDQPGTYTLQVSGFTSFQADFESFFIINATTGLNPIIISTSAACPIDSASSNACDKICAFGTATYEATGIPASAPITWTVQGAESYVANGNQLTVEWGAPGQGLVSVAAGTSTGSGLPMQVYCGQQSIDGNQPGGIFGTAYVRIFNGIGPYTFTITNLLTGAVAASGTFNNTFFAQPNLPAGSYMLTLTTGNGQTVQCPLKIVTTDSECWLNVLPAELVHPDSCGSCDGFVSPSVNGGSPPYTYTWSTGNTAPPLQGLCEGTYSLTVSDSEGCTATMTFSMSCPQTSCSGSASLCVEILEEPEAVINSVPPADANDIIAICQGQTVFFQNESLNASVYVWDFGDQNTSVQFEPSHTYNVPGTYNVMLIARNDCFCSDTSFVTVNVVAADVPEINCTGTICAGETVTYSTDASCGTYTWTITGSGTVLDGGGPTDNFITIEWTAGPEGSISLEVSGCSGNVCTLPNVVPIPIVSDNVQIQGPTKVCEGSTEEYFIPDYEGTAITWTVVGSGNITEGQGTERIGVNWYGDANIGNPQRVIVEFDNCYLGCSGKDTLEVFIVPGMYAKGAIEVCELTDATFQSFNTITDAPVNSNWTVFNAAGATVWTSAAATNTAVIPFFFAPGAYTVRAVPANLSSFCNDRYDLFVKLAAAPAPPSGIVGEDEICPGIAYTYKASGLLNGDFVWNISGGTPLTAHGNPINVTWNAAPPYSLSVSQISTTGLACESQPFDFNVLPLPNFDIMGDDEVCRETNGVYSVPFFENIDYEWVVTPADAGTVIAGDGTESVTVLFHKDGLATVSVMVCGLNKTFNVNVLTLPDPVAQHPSDICAGETPTVMTSVPYTSYEWKDNLGNVVSTLAAPMLGAGNFEVEVVDANGCVGDTIFEIVEHIYPPVKISTPAYQALCPGGPMVTLYSVVTGSGGYDYEWTLNGNPIGGNTPTLVTNQPGDYLVVVTDVNGCTANSNSLTLLDCAAVGGTCVGGMCVGGAPCPGCPPVPGCAANGQIDFTVAGTANCNAFTFTNTSVNEVPNSINWNFGDPGSGLNNTSILQNPSHTFSDIGWYTVLAIGAVEGVVPGTSCLAYHYEDVLVPVRANFENSPACPGTAMSFTDRSIFVTGASITGWSWNFGDASSGAANTSTMQNPTHVYANPGSYSVTLTITEASGCTVLRTKMVNVFALPNLDFDVPTQTCENTALPFDALVGNNVAQVAWDFGEPASGAANVSELINTFHTFGADGNYNVTLTALSIEGCSASLMKPITVTPNNLSGIIAFSQPSPICEGDSITLIAPPGGTTYLWSNGSPNISIKIYESSTSTVTLTDDEGCIYSPPPAIVDVVGEPNGIIKAVEYNEFGQPVAFFENNYSVCDGEDVFLVIQGSLSYGYVWSNGQTGNEVSFTEDKDNLLTVGTHNFTVTVTDNTSGCSSVEGPFTVTVNPNPTVQIASVPGGFICENTTATLNVVAPQAGLNYVWNTGEMTNSITVVAGGTYFVQAVNQFGCKGRSNEIELHNAPDIGKIPSGCHTRCEPDTMCLPPIADVATYQWFLEGVPMSAPNGTLPNPIFTESGVYSVQMTDIFGCTATSEVLTLDLFPGFGDIFGNVYYDVNNNGVIDAPDTLVSGINFFLIDGTVNLDTVTSIGGGYIFVGIPATDYTVAIDTAGLPTGWSAYLVSTALDIVGCDDEEEFDWLLTGCFPSSATLELEACEGDSVQYDGVWLEPGEMQTFHFSNFLGCDSSVVVTVLGLPTTTIALDLGACVGDSVQYDGIWLEPGETMDFVFTNLFGCDSTISVTVLELPSTILAVDMVACEGDSVQYNGVWLEPGETMDFVFVNEFGCDSIISVGVLGLPPTASTLDLTACEGGSATYNGTAIPAGSSMDFVFPNTFGCDSTVTVSVVAMPLDTSFLTLLACTNDSVEYAAVWLQPGEVQTFVLMNQLGCDSVVIVTVDEAPTHNELLTLQACENETVVYDGQTLNPGDVEIFPFQNVNGCDSIVTVTVFSLPVSNGTALLEGCMGGTVEYNGLTIPVGSEQTISLMNQYGCDSNVVVTVTALPPAPFDVTSDPTCWNVEEGIVRISNYTGSASPYQFSMDGTNYQSLPTFVSLAAGNYTVWVQGLDGCPATAPITVQAIPPIEIGTQDETVVCGDSVELRPTVVSPSDFTWLWDDGSTEPTLMVKTPGEYHFSVTNACETADRAITVTLDESNPISMIYVPNSFSPNGDGINDCFRSYVNPLLEVDNYVLKIFDRWGDQVFETTEIDGCWDGRFRGKEMNPAVLVWFIQFRTLNCEGEMVDVFREGGVTIVR